MRNFGGQHTENHRRGRRQHGRSGQLPGEPTNSYRHERSLGRGRTRGGMEWRPGRMTVGPPWFGAAALVVANGTDGCHVLYYLDNCQAFDYRSPLVHDAADSARRVLRVGARVASRHCLPASISSRPPGVTAGSSSRSRVNCGAARSRLGRSPTTPPAPSSPPSWDRRRRSGRPVP